MANLSKTTQDHEEIQRWAEERGGKPSHVKATGQGDDIGILRIDFPGYSGEDSLEEITWEQWFDKFDERNLALLYQEETAGGERSNFNKIVTSETAEANERGDHRKASGSKRSGGGSGAKKSGAKTASKKGGSGASSKKSSTSAKKSAVKKGAAKKAAPAKKTAAKKAPAKKTAVKKTAAKKTPAKKSGATKKSAAKKKGRR